MPLVKSRPVSLETLVDHVIRGRAPVQPESLLNILDPVTGEVRGRVALGGTLEVDAAVRAALEAFKTWATTPPHMRARVLFCFRDLVERDLDRLAALITADTARCCRTPRAK